jgi:hypothetical protein
VEGEEGGEERDGGGAEKVGGSEGLVAGELGEERGKKGFLFVSRRSEGSARKERGRKGRGKRTFPSICFSSSFSSASSSSSLLMRSSPCLSWPSQSDQLFLRRARVLSCSSARGEKRQQTSLFVSPRSTGRERENARQRRRSQPASAGGVCPPDLG